MLLLLVTLSSLLLAGIMTAVAWRTSYEERRRSEARVAALAADIHPDLDLRPPARAAAASPDLFRAQPGDQRERSGVAAVAGALVVLAIGAAAVVLSGTRTVSQNEGVNVSNPQPAAEPVRAVSPPAAPAPLELVGLSHEREGNQLVVRGTIRNPQASVPVDNVTAVVFLFNRDGGFLTSSRAGIAAASLAPGAEASFTVTVPDAGDVGRYRVSFRTDDRVLPHVDRRIANDDQS